MRADPLLSPRHYRRRQQSPLRRYGLGLLVALLLVVVLAAVFVVVQLLRAAPRASASVVLPASVRVADTSPLPWPAQAAAAAEIPGIGDLGGVRTGEVRPLASLTKLVTALVVLHDHPLTVGQSGPTIPITAADAAAYSADVAQQDSVLQVQAGEQLSELQLLEGMLVPSGDNAAVILADWDAGSTNAFVAKMNAEASTLGLTSTHLADPAGTNAASVGTAADVLKLGEAVMGNAVLRQVVAMPQVTLPVAGTVYNVDSLVGHDGIIGIKTGSTTEAGGNFAFAAKGSGAGRSLTVIGVVMGGAGQHPLQTALDDARSLAGAAFGQVRRVTVLPAGKEVVAIRAPWGRTVSGVTTGSVSRLAVPGQQFSVSVVRSPALASGTVKTVRAGERLATVEVRAGGSVVDVPVVATGSLSAAPLSYKLHNL